MSAIVFDGMTVSGRVAANGGINEAIDFEYRPLTNPTEARYLFALNGTADPAQQRRVSCRMLAEQLQSLDICFPDDYPDEALRGTPIPCKDEKFLFEHLSPYVTKIIAGIILGTLPNGLSPIEQGLSAQEIFKKRRQDREEQQGNSSAAAG